MLFVMSFLETQTNKKNNSVSRLRKNKNLWTKKEDLITWNARPRPLFLELPRHIGHALFTAIDQPRGHGLYSVTDHLRIHASLIL